MTIRIRTATMASICIITLSACAATIELNPKELVKALASKPGKWTYVDFPREVLGAGSIVSITDSSGISYRGNITDCIHNPDITEIKTFSAVLPNVKTTYELKAAALLSYHKVKVGPELKRVKKVEFKLGTLEEEVLSSIKIEDWLKANLESLSSTCNRYLRGGGSREQQELRGTIFVLTDVLKVTGYEYSFSKDNNVKVKLEESTLKDYLTLSGNVSYSVTQSGSLKIDTPVYIAFKTSVFLPERTGAGASSVEGANATDILNRRLELFE